MKRKFVCLLVVVCFSVLISSAEHLGSKCEFTCQQKKMQQENTERQAARNTSDYVFPFNAIFSLW